MREIKFRAKTKHNQFVIGSYINTGELHFISRGVDKEPFIPISPETVGQFTGRKDKSGKDIYEGDIISVLVEKNEAIYRLKFNPESKRFLGVARYIEHQCKFEIVFTNNDFDIAAVEIGWAGEDFEVVGNIYENPELLEGV